MMTWQCRKQIKFMLLPWTAPRTRRWCIMYAATIQYKRDRTHKNLH